MFYNVYLACYHRHFKLHEFVGTDLGSDTKKVRVFNFCCLLLALAS